MRTSIIAYPLFNKLLTAMVIIALMLVALPVMPVSAGTITVNTVVDEIVDDNVCSLREAIIAADADASANGCVYTGTGPDDIITLQSGQTYTLSRVGATSTTGDLDVNGNLTIQASGTANAIVDANGINRVFEAGQLGNVNLTLIRITVTNGNAPDGAGIFFDGAGTLTLQNSAVLNNTGTGAMNCGAGIYNNTAANIVITNSTIAGNSCTDLSGDGAGLFKGGGGTVTITNSTFSGNTAADNGGGANFDTLGGTVTIRNSTFANNTAGGRGGGIRVAEGTVTVDFSTFSGNAANVTGTTSIGGGIQASGGSVTVTRSILANSTTNSAPGQDCDQTAPGAISVSNSIVEVNSDCTVATTSSSDPGLGALASNGGPTMTMAITSASPAFNAVQNCSSASTDQRGVSRPQGAACDLGAYEAEPDPTPVAPGKASLVSPSGGIGTNNPTYTWNQVSGATWYYLWVNGPSGNIFKKWYTSAQANCNGSTCSVAGATPNLGTGTHTWWVQTWNDVGFGPWSDGMSFSLATPGAATLVSPSGSVTTNTPTFTWNQVSGATWYYLWVNGPSGNVIKQWYEATNAICNGSTCSVTPTTALAAGNHTWWVQTWNSAGFGAWSSGMSFSVTPPGKASLVSPSGSIGSNTPTFTWNQVSGATWYYLWVNGPSGNVIKQWFEATNAICNGSTCSVASPATLGSGAHTWWVQTWNPAGFGPWSDGTGFTTP